MNADLTHQCYDAEWNANLPYMISMVFLYPIGLPALVFTKLYLNRDTLDTVATKLELGFLFECYTPKFWWFEIVDMFYKLTVTSLVGFVPVEFQLQFATAFVMVYMMIVLLCSPYRRQSDDQLLLLCLCESLLLVYSGFLIYINEDVYGLDAVTDYTLSLFLIFCTLMIVLLALLFASKTLLRILSKYDWVVASPCISFIIHWMEKPVTALSRYTDSLDNFGRHLFLYAKQVEQLDAAIKTDEEVDAAIKTDDSTDAAIETDDSAELLLHENPARETARHRAGTASQQQTSMAEQTDSLFDGFYVPGIKL
jgi:hypothetical protein